MFDTLKTVLIGTSLTEMSDPVVRAGLDAARASGARVFLVHAFQPQWAYAGGPYLSEAFIQETLEAERTLAEKNLVDQIARLGIRPEELAGRAVAYGPPHRVVIDAADEVKADLVVVGSTESPQLSKLFGSTADRVIRKADWPVLMVRGDLAVPPRRVLMPVDLSPLSGLAFRKGLTVLRQLAPVSGVEIEALFVMEGSGHPLASEGATRHELETFVLRNAAGTGRQVSTRLLQGPVEEEIRKRTEKWKADLIILGTHGRGGFERFLLGSVASDVVRHGPASVLVIPPELAPETVRVPAREQVAAFA
jgi:nucleotide-binding universal stress UspA family protein